MNQNRAQAPQNDIKYVIYQGARTVPEDPEKKPEELWERVFGTEVRSHEASVKNLEKGKNVKFRVRAVNEAGEGQAGEQGAYAVVEEQTEDPEIRLDSLLKDGLTIKTGKQLRSKPATPLAQNIT